MLDREVSWSGLLAVDASQAGSGNIEIRVNEGRVACSVENLGKHRFLASFVPENCKLHEVDMTFNEKPIEGKIVAGHRAATVTF